MQWFYSDGSQSFGPVAGETLLGWLRSGQLGHQTLIWTNALPSWKTAGEVFPELTPAAAPVVAVASMTPVAAGVGALPVAAMPVNNGPTAGQKFARGAMRVLIYILMIAFIVAVKVGIRMLFR